MSPVIRDPQSDANQARAMEEFQKKLKDDEIYKRNVKIGALMTVAATGLCAGSCLFFSLVRPDLVEQGLTVLRNLP